MSNFDQAFRSFEQHKSVSPEWVGTLRKSAKAEFLKTGLPSLRDENWKYTSLRSLANNTFTWTHPTIESVPAFVRKLFIPEASNIVFVDGKLIKNQDIAQGVQLCSLEEAFAKFPDKIQETLQLSSSVCQNTFTQLNDAFLAEGSFLYIPSKSKISKTVHFLNYITSTHSKSSFPRHILYLDKHAELSVIETIVSENSDEQYFTNSVSDILLHENSQISYAKFQRKNSAHTYLGNTRFLQKADSRAYCFFDIGHSALSREEISVKLSGERAESRIRGIFHTHERQHVDYFVSVDHAASFTKSRQLFKGVADDQSRGVFNAHIRVREGLRKIDAHQLTKNLLLGNEAEIDARPHLEIDSDDVKCAHGAAVGRLRSEEVFYLQARGMTRAKAEKMLSTAFTEEVVLDIKDEQFRKQIQSHESHLSAIQEMSISGEKE